VLCRTKLEEKDNQSIRHRINQSEAENQQLKQRHRINQSLAENQQLKQKINLTTS
jgi:hypothetical protein